MRIEKGIHFIDGAGFSSGNPTWALVSITAKAVEKKHDEGDQATSRVH